MDFFDRQDQARRNTRRLVFLFILATIAIVLAVDFIVSLVIGNIGDQPVGIPNLAWVQQNWPVLMTSTIGTLGLIGASSLARSASLRAGGGRVAQQLGGARVSPESRDPARRQLYNIVEEMSLASGVPVPEIYVLEHEPGINAFAAGLTTGDAAVAVTRGAVERLNRDELQGVIGHEFSHILNGDMRLNMRLVGLLFGILVIAIFGRMILRGSYFRSSKDNRAGAAIVMVGIGLLIVGYVGLFFGRMIKAAVSRQREFLADASSVQFTRQTDGLAGALKKIGGYEDGSIIRDADAEEYSHMMFATGSKLSSLLATHPPIEERIKALDASFDPAGYRREPPAGQIYAGRPHPADSTKGFAAAQPDKPISPEVVVSSVGDPQPENIAIGMELRATVPDDVYAAATSQDGSLLVTLALLLDPQKSVRDIQLDLIGQQLGPDGATRTDDLATRIRSLGPRHRLAVLELAFPALKEHPLEQLKTLLTLAQTIIRVDGVVDPFEFALAVALRTHLYDAQYPNRRQKFVRMRRVRRELAMLFAVVAGFGHDSDTEAENAYQHGLSRLLGEKVPAYSRPEQWASAADETLLRLDKLAPQDKRKVVAALAATIGHNQKVTTTEAELFRATCAALHCPVPPVLIR